MHATFACDREYKRLGTVSLLAGIDLVTGQVHALVKDGHRSREFVEFLQLLDAAWEAVAAELASPENKGLDRAHLTIPRI